MKQNFSFKEGMVLVSFSFLEVREAATAPEFFLENGIKLCFLKPFSADFMFCFVRGFVWGGGCHQSLNWRVCD